jgi:RHS repeat-associated protein
VQGWNTNGTQGNYSSIFSFTTTASGAPGSFTLSNDAPVCDTAAPAGPAVRLNWTIAAAATSYDIYRNGSLYYSDVTGTTFYNNLNLTAGQTFTYFIRARNSFGTRDSNQISVPIPSNICSTTTTPTITNYSWNIAPVDHQNFSGTITGTGFVLGTRVFFCVSGTSTCYEQPQAGIIVNNAGTLNVSNVNLGAGSYQIYVQTAAGSSNKSTSFTVATATSTQPALSVSPSSAPLGTTFSFTGVNFSRSSIVTLTIMRPDGSQAGTGKYSTDTNGSVSFQIISQSSDPTGTWTFSLSDAAGKQASKTAQYTSSQPSGTDAVAFIADVTIPDNTQVVAGSTFIKTWRLKNTGTSSWNGYTAVFVSSPSNGLSSINLSATGATSITAPSGGPGQTVDLSTQMRAPSPGTYYSYWQLRNSSGVSFGVQFYVKIRVVAKQATTLGFGTQSGRGGTNDAPPAKWAANSDPVNTATGNYNYASTDLRVPGRGVDVEIARSYNSQDGTLGPLGIGWSHSFNVYLTNITSSSATVHYSDGKMLDYINDPGTSTFKASYPGIYDTLTKNTDGTWTLSKTDQRKYQFDSSGRLISVKDRNNNQVSLTHSGGNLSQVVDTVGRVFTFTYSGSLLTRITDPIGRTLQFTYDANSNLISFRDANGNTNTYTYDVNSRLTKIIDGRGNNLLINSYGTACPPNITSCVATQTNGRGNLWTFTYNSDGSTTVADPLGNPTKYLQDVNFNIQQTQDRNSNLISLHYDEINNRDQISDAKGNPTAYAYDQNGNVLSRTDPTLTTRQATYDSNNNPTRVTDELGKSTQMSYDAKGNLISVTDPLNNSSSTTYDSFGQPLTIADSNGNTTTNTYDSQGNVISVKDALNNITSYGYDAVDRRTSMTDARGRVTRYTYDANDNLLTITDPLSGVTTYAYDANNNRISMRDPRGNTTTYGYDENNLLVKETDAKGFFVQHTYDKLDRRISTRDKRGNLTNFAYDDEGRLISVTQQLGNITRYTYDANGNRTQITDAKNQTATFTYDAANRVTQIQDALGNSIQKQYDPAGRLAKEVDPRGNPTQFTYDALGNVIQVTDAAGGTAKYTYDKNQNRIAQTDPNNRTSNLGYDRLNRLLSMTNPLGHTSSYSYDEVGNRISQTDANGRTTRYAYDGDNRLVTITYPDNSAVQFTRDANGNVMRMVDSLGTSTYVYDELNRVTSVTDPFGKTIGYQYDEDGNITKLTYPDGKQVTYQFDANNRMVSFTDWAAKTTMFQYDSTNLLTRVTYPNGIVTSFTYDNAGRLIAKSDSSISSYTFTLDKNGNRISATITQPLANRLYRSSQSYTYDAANRIQNAGPTTFAFDNNGNMTSKTEGGVVTTYTYDAENRLVSVGNVSQYFYNGEGVRLQKIENGKTTRYVIDTNNDLSQTLCETDTTGSITAYYVYGIGLAYKVDPNGTHSYYSSDPVGSITALTNDVGTVVNSYAYDPFGHETVVKESVTNPFRYNGQYGVSTEANGLLFLRSRYYDPNLGRFLTADIPTEHFNSSQALNRYYFVSNNPIRLIDPSGLSWIDTGISWASSLSRNAAKEAVKEALIQFIRREINKHGFDMFGEALFQVSLQVPLIGSVVSVTIDAREILNNPNLSGTEKAARISLKIANEAIIALFRNPLTGVAAGTISDVTFEWQIRQLKKVGEPAGEYLYRTFLEPSSVQLVPSSSSVYGKKK